ncbi:MAG: MlaD family protein [Acidobacteriota bacterium]|nr:MlaD family protein [Acidobacteriota bacterium]
MASNRFTSVSVGAFVVFGVLLFAVGLFIIGSRRMLFEDTFHASAEFANLSGLQNGAIVRVAGMDAGEVDEIRVPGSPSGRFSVRMRLREELHTLIRVDSVASIQTDGLVGNKYVQVDAGTDQAAIVPPDGTMKSTEPLDLAEMLNRMSKTIDLVTGTIVDVKAGVEEALGSVTETARSAQDLMTDVGKDARAIMTSTQKATADVNAIVAGVREGRGTVGKLLTDDAFYASMKNIAAEAEKTVTNLREASTQAKGAIADFRGDGGPMKGVKGVTGDLQQTLTSAKDAMADLAENTEALKRSFFFRGFFNKRGYFDLEDVTLRQYREGALQTGDRHVLRIWVGTPVLFEAAEDGGERLSDAGRRRVDSAMSTFVKYPENSPLVVEGYAKQRATSQARFLLSRSRAELVRDYIVGKYRREGNHLAIMPMGAEAVDSPSGAQWDGVALAMFVSSSAL